MLLHTIGQLAVGCPLALASRGQHWAWGFLPDAEPGRGARQSGRTDKADNTLRERYCSHISGAGPVTKGRCYRASQNVPK